jgi:hypothetical protein
MIVMEGKVENLPSTLVSYPDELKWLQLGAEKLHSNIFL